MEAAAVTALPVAVVAAAIPAARRVRVARCTRLRKRRSVVTKLERGGALGTWVARGRAAASSVRRCLRHRVAVGRLLDLVSDRTPAPASALLDLHKHPETKSMEDASNSI